MNQRTIQGTPWHMGFGDRKKEDDPRRHKVRCVYFRHYDAESDMENYCLKSHKYCKGSAHCTKYSESLKINTAGTIENKDMLEGINPDRLFGISNERLKELKKIYKPVEKIEPIKGKKQKKAQKKTQSVVSKKVKDKHSQSAINTNIAFVFEEDCENFKKLKNALLDILKDKDLGSAYFSQQLSLSAPEINKLNQILNYHNKDIGCILVSCMQRNGKIFSINVKKLCCIINDEKYFSFNYLYTKTINNYFEVHHFIIDLIKSIGIKRLCLNLDDLKLTQEQSQQLSSMLNKIFTNQKLEYPLSLLEDIIKQSLSVGKYYTLDFNQSVFKGLIKKYNKEQASSSSNLD